MEFGISPKEVKEWPLDLLEEATSYVAALRNERRKKQQNK